MNRYCLVLAVALPYFAMAETILNDTLDEFTDERNLMVGIISDNDNPLGQKDALVFLCKKGEILFAVRPGEWQFHIGDTINVKLRFDDLPH